MKYLEKNFNIPYIFKNKDKINVSRKCALYIWRVLVHLTFGFDEILNYKLFFMKRLNEYWTTTSSQKHFQFSLNGFIFLTQLAVMMYMMWIKIFELQFG